MKDKNIIIAIGLIVIMLIIVGIVSVNLKQARHEIKALNASILQKNIDTEKVVKQLAAKQEELNGVKTEFGDANKKLDSIKKDIGSNTKNPIALPSKIAQ